MTTMQLFANNAKGVLASPVSANAVSIALISSASFPTPNSALGQFTLATLHDEAFAVFEIVKITGNADNVLTVVRAQEGTEARLWPVEGTVIEGFVTKDTLSNFAQGLANDHAVASNSIALGGITNRVQDSYMIGRYPVAKMEDGDRALDRYTCAPTVVRCTPQYDLGVPPPWAPATVYKHGDIVVPTTPNGFQYRLWMPDDPANPTKKLSLTSGSTEPDFQPYSWYPRPEGAGEWQNEEPIVGGDGIYLGNQPVGTVFVPQQFGFLCHKFSALTGTPTVSVGTWGNLTKWVNNQSVSINSVYGIHYFTGVPSIAAPRGDTIVFTINSSATAGRCVGRFFVIGFFVELPDHI
jgi:hypothetical protein